MLAYPHMLTYTHTHTQMPTHKCYHRHANKHKTHPSLNTHTHTLTGEITQTVNGLSSLSVCNTNRVMMQNQSSRRTLCVSSPARWTRSPRRRRVSSNWLVMKRCSSAGRMTTPKTRSRAGTWLCSLLEHLASLLERVAYLLEHLTSPHPTFVIEQLTSLLEQLTSLIDHLTLTLQ